jgi:hypothetical protein
MFRQFPIETDYGRARAATLEATRVAFGPLPEVAVEEVARIDEPPVSGKRVRLRAGSVVVDEHTTLEVLPDKMLVRAYAITLHVHAEPHTLVVIGAGPIVVDGEPARPSIGQVSGMTVRYQGPDESVGVAFFEALRAAF